MTKTKAGKNTRRSRLSHRVKLFTGSVWLWPALLLVLVTGLATFKVHGSSVGMYNKFFYGENYDDPNLLLGQPRPIRSDEWLSNTPMTVSQAFNDFPMVNQNVGGGHDMTVVKDFPTKSWESIFKPQNWGFFFLPLENAFALRWLLLSFLLIVSAYFFVLELLPRKRMLATLISVAFYLSPFLHWWYLYTSFGSVFYTLFALTLLMRLHKTQQLKLKVLYGGGVVFVAVADALILYPPFQISAAVAGGFFYLGWVAHHFNLRDKKEWLRLFKDWALIALAGAAALALLYIYYVGHKEVIRAIMNSEHPGKRRILSGDRNWLYFIHEWSSQFSYRLQFPGAGVNYYANQSESSNFILFAPWLIPPSLYIIFKDWRAKLKPDYILIALNLALILLLVRQHIPGTDILFKPFALDRVPNYRLLLGVGVTQFLLIVVYFRRNIAELFKSRVGQILQIATGLAAFGFFLWTGFYTDNFYKHFLGGYWEVILAALVMALIVYLVISGRLAGLVLLILFSAISVGLINPVYRGLGGLPDNKLSTEIRRVSNAEDNWAVMEDIRFENIVLSSGRPSLTALYSYPRLDLWRTLDPTGDQSSIYNRSAHVVFFDKPHLKQSQLIKLAVNKFGVLLNPCSTYPKQANLKYLLTQRPINSRCTKLISTVPFPAATFYIYRLTP